MTSLYAGFDVVTFPGLARMKSLKKNTCLHWCGYYLEMDPRSHTEKELAYTWSGHYPQLHQMGWGVAPLYRGYSTHKEADKTHDAKWENPVFHNLRAPHPGSRSWTSRQQVRSIGLTDVEKGMHNYIKLGHDFSLDDKYDVVHKSELGDHLFFYGLYMGFDAASLAGASGFPKSTVIYFDMESQPNADCFWFPQWTDYYRGWCVGVGMMGYRHGLYANPALLGVVIGAWSTPSRYGVLRYPFIWVAAYRRAVDTVYTVLTDAIYQGSKVTKGTAVAEVPSLDAYGANYLGEWSWQFMGIDKDGLGFYWRDQDQSNAWKTQPADLSFSLSQNPGLPEHVMALPSS